ADLMNETALLQKVRTAAATPAGRARAQAAIAKATAKPTLDLDTLQKAQRFTTKLLTGSGRPTADECAAYDAVVKALQPKRKPDPVMLSMFAKHRDSTVEEQAALDRLLVEMAAVLREETGQP